MFIRSFEGTILFISHDRYFINKIATRVIEVQKDQCLSYNGNYDDYLKDYDVFREQKNMDNNSFRQLLIESKQKIAESAPIVTANDEFKEQKIDVLKVPSFVEDMLGMFRSIKYCFPNGMSENGYRSLLGEMANNFKYIQDALPRLKTNEQVKLEKEEEEKIWLEKYSAEGYSDLDDLWKQWNETSEEKPKNR